MVGTDLDPSHPRVLPELLAPAGNVESFFAALENGADAIYLGLKSLSARASATNFTLGELSRLLPFAHHRGVALYVALNSLVTAQEVPAVLDLLQSLADLKVDALIVQDPGILYLARRYFPTLKLHGSTLVAIHNSAGVNRLGRLGVRRVVLARELTLAEIKMVADRTEAELEIFVHGALCFSYSGLCLASSFRGGHGALQGRCVQPCRLRFRQGAKAGFFLSCNDFSALPLLPQLKRLRLAAFKIEGRMKPPDYVAQVVKAYRRVLDALPDEEEIALKEAQQQLLEAPARRLTRGFLGDHPGQEVLTPHRSGASGLWVGTIRAVREQSIAVTVRHEIQAGDRLRVESDDGKEKSAFRVTEILSEKGENLPAAGPGSQVALTTTRHYAVGERLFKVAGKAKNLWKSPSTLWRMIQQETPNPLPFARNFIHRRQVEEEWPAISRKSDRSGDGLTIKIGRAQDLVRAFQSPADCVFLIAGKANLEQMARQKLTPGQKKRFAWSLPPLILEKDLDYTQRAVSWYRDRGYHTWEVNNWSHFEFFEKVAGLHLIAGCRFNLRNRAALACVADAGCQRAVLSLEITRKELQELSQGPLSVVPVVQVYGWPPLFLSRLPVKLRGDRALLTPRQEVLHLRQEKETTRIYADRPVNWMGQLMLLRSYGYRDFLLDLSEGPKDQPGDMDKLFSDFRQARAVQPYALFNFEREPFK